MHKLHQMRKLLLWIGIWACVQVAVTSCQQKRSNTEWIRLADEQVYRNVDSIKTLLAKVHRPL